MLLIQSGRLITMEDDTECIGDLLIEDGKIKAISSSLDPAAIFIPEGEELTVLDASGCLVYPGLIEAHCHIGITEAKMAAEGDDCNEVTNPLTPQLRALDAVNPMDAAFDDAVRAGITSVMAGPGSANVVGGQFLFMKTKGREIDRLCVLEPAAMKVAFGENPKVNYGGQSKMPGTRMAIAAMLREELFEARQYYEEWKENKDSKDWKPDFVKECWIPVFEGRIPMKAHVHRADDILTAIRIAKEFHLELTLDHCSEGHLIAKEVAASGFPAIVGPDFASRNKIEVQNMAFKTAGVLSKAGVKVAITTDHPVSLIQSLPLCAGLAAKSGLGKREAMRAITINPAQICRVDHRVGSLKPGKDADIAIFDGNPMEIFTHCLYTIIDGNIVYDYHKDQKTETEEN